MRNDRQPPLSKELVDDARSLVASLSRSMPRQDAAVLVHLGAMVQHAATVRLIDDGLPLRAGVEAMAALHPSLSGLPDLPGLESAYDEAVTALWGRHQLMEPENVVW